MDMDKRYRKMTRKCGFWMGTALFLLGLLIGYLAAPSRHGNRFTNFGHIHDCPGLGRLFNPSSRATSEGEEAAEEMETGEAGDVPPDEDMEEIPF